MKPKTRLISKTLFLAISLSGCAHGDRNLHGKLWQGDHDADAISRKQDEKSLKCGDPLFDQYTCLKTVDLQNYGKACDKWRQ